MKNKLLFLSNFIRNPVQTGAIAPSSRFLTREMMRNIDFETSSCIVELGPGLGTFTKEIVSRAKEGTRLFCFEVNEKFLDHLSRNFSDERLVFVNESAEKLGVSLKKLNVKEVECIVSGLPFGNFPDAKKRKILQEVRDSLGEGGKFVLFQYTNGLGKLLESYFSRVTRKFVPLNLPPSFVYVCEK